MIKITNKQKCINKNASNAKNKSEWREHNRRNKNNSKLKSLNNEEKLESKFASNIPWGVGSISK